VIVPSATVAVASVSLDQVTAARTAALSSASVGTVSTVIARVSPTAMLAVACESVIPVALFGATLLGTQ